MSASIEQAPATGPHYSGYTLNAVLNVAMGLAFIAVVGFIPEPARQIAMALMLGFGALVYARHGLNRWEWVLGAAVGACAALGFFFYPAIGIGWLIHTASDILHHRIGRPLYARIPMSSFGCAVFDPVIAVWFFLGAPAALTLGSWR